MLLQFVVENFLSFRQPVTLSLLATPGVEHDARQVIVGPNGQEVLRCAAIYGANASGKSNLVKALDFARRLILSGTRSGEPIGVKPFKLDDSCQSAPSRFELEVGAEGARYSYGFEVTNERVESEWLFVTKGSSEQRLFERTLPAEEAEPSRIEIDAALSSSEERRQFLKFVAEGTRPNQLFLTEAIERNVVELSPLVVCIRKLLVVLPYTQSRALGRRLGTDASFRSFASTLLSAAGTGIDELHVKQLDGDEIDDELVLGLGFKGKDNINEISLYQDGVFVEYWQIKFAHRDRNGKPVLFSGEEESDGTRRLLHLGSAIYHGGYFYFIDELERSLHPLLTRMFVERFLAEGATPGAVSSQLVFTTHDTNLLDLSLLSRDSIWFTEKDPHGASTLYSLADFDPKQLAELGPNLEKGYLQGRFGAIPFFGNPARLAPRDTQGS